jgi:hypothetical protein
MRKALGVGIAVAAWLGMPASADAFVLHTTTGGAPLRWGVDAVTMIADASFNALDPGADAAARAAFAAWDSVAGAQHPALSVVDGAVDDVGYRVGEQNQSTIRYAPAGFALAGDTLAITVLTFDAAGTILDADIVVNGRPGRAFRVLGDDDEDETSDAFDLQDVLTHEAGHLFGLAHNNADPSVTMYFEIQPGETSKRHLANDDEQGLRALYPETAGATPMAASCAASAGPRGSAPGGAVAAALGLAAAGLARARRFRSRALAGVAALVLAPLMQWSGAGAADVASAATLATTARATPTGEAATARVSAATPRWDDGLVVTELTLETRGEAPTTLEVYGGVVAGIEQVVGGRAVPAVGDELAVRRDEARRLRPVDLAVRRAPR